MKCLHCGRELRLIDNVGWIHSDMFSAYVMRCKDCGYEGRGAYTCPNCDSKNYIEDHYACPDFFHIRGER